MTFLNNFIEFIHNKKKSLFILSIFSLFFVIISFIVLLSINTLIINDNGNTIKVYTVRDSIEDILDNAGLTLIDSDTTEFSGWEKNRGTLNIFRSNNIKLTVDGNTYEFSTSNKNVKSLLESKDIIVGELDEVSLDLEKQLEEGDHIVIQRVEHRVTVIKELIPFGIDDKPSSFLNKGIIKVSSNGQNGEIEKVLKEIIVDGKVISSEIIEEKKIKDPVSETRLIGSAESYIPSSSVPSNGFALDSSGKPIKYKKMLNGRAAAYSAKAGAKTASGLLAKPGHVAVNPQIIPYGTKMYIESSDGSYVYGYAIAADTGTALMEGKIIVDVFFNTKAESKKFGIKNVNIYILD